MKKIEEVYQALVSLEDSEDSKVAVTTCEISSKLKSNRANISRHLNKLYQSGKIDKLVGADNSLLANIQQAKAAILYPPRGLHTMLVGETGTGKSMFAELMYQFARETGVITKQAPFIQFNCADYADNPQLITAQIFGVIKGAYTGADRDREGLLKKADGGILFLGEVHRLSPQGQEMLFTFMDKGYFRPLGETERELKADVQIVSATTADPGSSLLNTFTRRIPMIISLPSLQERGLEERFALIASFLKRESARIKEDIYVNKNSLISLLLYDSPNNIGQLHNDIQLCCARAFLNYKNQQRDFFLISQMDLPQHVKKGLMNIPKHRSAIDQLMKNQGEVLCFSYQQLPVFINNGEEEKHF